MFTAIGPPPIPRTDGVIDSGGAARQLRQGLPRTADGAYGRGLRGSAPRPGTV